ncbi:MAG: O-antigen ligase family protein [Phycisphaerae bacterium]|nr:O-antigen ligase family protein [Phycisphaerae bacterium]
MLIQIIIAIVLVAAVIVYLCFFRAEGIFAFYVFGMNIIYLVTGTLGISWSTEATGAVFPVLFFPCVLWWLLSKNEPSDLRLPRQFGLSVILILFLAGFWQAKHLWESQFLGRYTVYEHYKWMYMIARWIAPFLLGIFFPLTIKRLKRFFLASALLTLLMAVWILLSFVLGIQAAEAEARYSPVERLGGLHVGIFGGLGAACLMGYMLLIRQVGGKKFPDSLVWSSIAFIAMAMFASGSRGPIVSLGMTLIVVLLLFGGRNAVRVAIGLTIVGVLMFACWHFLPQAAIQRITGEGAIVGEGGTGLRWRLFLSSFNILKVAPFLGQTMELNAILQVGDVDTTHQITTQVMVEMGLFGLTLFLIAFMPTVVIWLRTAFQRSSSLRPIAISLAPCLVYELAQRHIAGQLANHDFWILMGILMGHRLVLAGGRPQEKEQWTNESLEAPPFTFEPLTERQPQW